MFKTMNYVKSNNQVFKLHREVAKKLGLEKLSLWQRLNSCEESRLKNHSVIR